MISLVWAALVGCGGCEPEPTAQSRTEMTMGGEPAPGLAVTDRVLNPISGTALAVWVDLPVGAGPHPAVVWVPGGKETGKDVIPPPVISEWLSRGFALFRWDPDGRGASEGEEDLGGAVHQAGLRAVVNFARFHDFIDPTAVGIVSFSYGSSMAAGALADGDHGVAWLIDWEGPADRTYTAACLTDKDIPDDPFEGIACDDESFWFEREAVNRIGTISIPYLRLQSAKDHVHGRNRQHAIDMVQAARDGALPWVGLNDLDMDQSTEALQVAPLPLVDRQGQPTWVLQAAEDLSAGVMVGEDPIVRPAPQPKADSEVSQRGKRSKTSSPVKGAKGGAGGRSGPSKAKVRRP